MAFLRRDHPLSILRRPRMDEGCIPSGGPLFGMALIFRKSAQFAKQTLPFYGFFSLHQETLGYSRKSNKSETIFQQPA